MSKLSDGPGKAAATSTALILESSRVLYSQRGWISLANLSPEDWVSHGEFHQISNFDLYISFVVRCFARRFQNRTVPNTMHVCWILAIQTFTIWMQSTPQSSWVNAPRFAHSRSSSLSKWFSQGGKHKLMLPRLLASADHCEWSGRLSSEFPVWYSLIYSTWLSDYWHLVAPCERHVLLGQMR